LLAHALPTRRRPSRAHNTPNPWATTTRARCAVRAEAGYRQLALLVLLGSCQTKQPPTAQTYVIVADIEGCTDCRAKLYLQGCDSFDVLDTLTAKDGHFSLRGTLA
jgi:hypothetical protein